MKNKNLLSRALHAKRFAIEVLMYNTAKITNIPAGLTTIANYHASDKGTLHGYGSMPMCGHNYTPIYEKYFSSFRNSPIKLLEIGIGINGPGSIGTTVFGRNRGGASLKMWKDYFRNGMIYGIDLNDASFLNDSRIQTFTGDQGSRESLLRIAEAIGCEFDVIIDDGSHASIHQQITMAALLPFLKKGGVYVIEDLDYQPPAIEKPDHRKTSDVLFGFSETGRFESQCLTDVECSFLSHGIRDCVQYKINGPTSEIAFLYKAES